MHVLVCPQCEGDTDGFEAGICPACYASNHDELTLHNARFDQWERMSDAERDAAIRWASK